MRGGGLREWTLHPVGLIHRGPVTYLVCTLGEHGNTLQLPLHRFLWAKPSTFDARPPAPTAMQEAKAMVASGFINRGPVRLVMEMDAAAATHLQEARLSADQAIEPSETEDWVVVSATVDDTDQLRWWLRGYGDQVEILEPADLREWMAASLADAASYYEED